MARPTKKAALKAVPTAELIERFVCEAALTDPNVAATYEEREKHVKNVEAYADELGRRDDLAAFTPLLDSGDDWIAYAAAHQLIQFEVAEDCALATLDRIADAQSGGVTSGFANRARNMVRFGHPSGAFKPPTEVERAFLRVVTLGYPIVELQVETCLISEWDGLFLTVRVFDGAPLVHSEEPLGPIPGPTVATNRDDVYALESNFRSTVAACSFVSGSTCVARGPYPIQCRTFSKRPDVLRSGFAIGMWLCSCVAVLLKRTFF